MIRMIVERQYMDVFQGSIYCALRGEEKKLTEFVFTRNSEWMYKREPFELDGTYNIKYDHFGEDGYQFRPIINWKGLDIRFQNKKHPEPMLKNIIYLLVKKDKWERMCRHLYAQNEKECEISRYNSRRDLELIPEVFLQLEDEDDKLLDEWEEEN